MLDRVREPVQQVAVRPRLIPVLLLFLVLIYYLLSGWSQYLFGV